jgi:hypothetical protein
MVLEAINKGVRKGSPLSPVALNIYINEVEAIQNKQDLNQNILKPTLEFNKVLFANAQITAEKAVNRLIKIIRKCNLTVR